jgi:hypothetical protein
MTRITRNRICIWIIFLGLANFVTYTVMYWYLQGDAKNGAVIEGKYYVRGHFIRERAGLPEEVGRSLWLYSYVHSISIWPTIGAVLVAMFILARPHIIATMKSDAMIRGPTFITASITTIVILTGASTFYFILTFVRALMTISKGQNWGL